MVYRKQFGSRASTIFFKYLGQWAESSRILRHERPDVVFVMSPPLVAAFPAFWYAWRNGRQVVLDAHSAAFLHPRWRRLQWLQRMLCRRAATTLVHNEHLAQEVRRGGAHAIVVADVPIVFADVEPFPRSPAFTVAVVCSFNADEPLAAILDAARRMPDVQFRMTGDPRHFPRDLRPTVPPNLVLTGFLSTAAYGGLISDADVVLTLTTRDHTMLRGAYEAVYQGTPAIVSDWPLLRAAFDEGALHVDNSPEGIVAAIRAMQADPQFYRDGALRLRARKLERWRAVRASILERVCAREGHPAA
jgi:glycosyltransferase involved in cell wall biosynthesis